MHTQGSSVMSGGGGPLSNQQYQFPSQSSTTFKGVRADARLKVKGTRRRKSSGGSKGSAKVMGAVSNRDENAENDQRQAQRLLNEGRMNKDLIVGGEEVQHEEKKGKATEIHQIKRVQV